MYFRKRGGQIVPADEESAEAFKHIEEGRPFRAEPKTERNLRQNALYHKVLQLVADNHDTYDTIEKVKTALKVATGEVDTFVGYDGRPYLVPRSTRFDAMPQHKFDRFMRNCFHVITTRFLPGVEGTDLFRQLDEMMHGPPPEDPRA